MTGMANNAAMSQMMNRDYQNMRLTSPGMQRYNNNAQNWGAKAGYLNRQEYVSLGNYSNETSRLKGIYGKGGISPHERGMLANRQRTYDKMYQRYSYGNYHPRTLARDGVQQRQINQLNRTYGGVRSGEMTMGEGQRALEQQQGISRTKGVYQRRGGWNNMFGGHLDHRERGALHRRLNSSSRDIHRMKNNWRTDWNRRW
ncbi:MAG: hypothetical protein K8T10_15060 [Candidatus Eremiobacteraeota bacterium]|nr:hypothetical protein [Candidatus Eremiobacteraeota bacterium]